MKYVLKYESAVELDFTKIREHFPAHRARWQAFRDNGSLLMIGPFTDPRQGALGIFTTREAAEEFAVADPFVLHGVVASWTVNEWNEALSEDVHS